MGDKKFGEGDTGRLLESYDYHFISGPKHLEKLRDSGVNIPESRRVEIGNLRFDGYVNRIGGEGAHPRVPRDRGHRQEKHTVRPDMEMGSRDAAEIRPPLRRRAHGGIQPHHPPSQP